MTLKCIKDIIKKRICKKDWKQKIKELKKTHIISVNMYHWRKYIEIHYNPMEEYHYLPGISIKIMKALRSQVLNLNLNLHVREHSDYYRIQKKQQNGHIQFMICNDQCCTPNNTGRCTYDNKLETIKHYMIDCMKYEILRKDLYDTIAPYYHFYNIPIQLKTILFVPKYYHNDQHQKRKIRWQHRKMILNSVIKYVIHTKRINWFKNN